VPRLLPPPPLKRPLPIPAPTRREPAEGPLPASLYRLIWQVSGRLQLRLCALTLAVVLLSAVPLELQRRIIDDALGANHHGLLALLATLYLVTILVQGGLKYTLNLSRGRVVEEVNLTLRELIYRRTPPRGDAGAGVESGTIVSMVAAEVEDLGGFAGEGVSLPLQEAGTALVVTGYLLWLEPLIASIAVLLYLPQLIVVPRVQRIVNLYARGYAKFVRLLGEHIVREHETGVTGPRAARRFQRLVAAIYGARMRVYRLKYFLTFFGNFLDATGPLMVLTVGGLLVLHGLTEISTLVVFISGIQRMVDPLGELVNFYRTAAMTFVRYDLIRKRLR
jgi:ABC-type multidrug transport system fused ATPase/permease subunit